MRWNNFPVISSQCAMKKKKFLELLLTTLLVKIRLESWQGGRRCANVQSYLEGKNISEYYSILNEEKEKYGAF